MAINCSMYVQYYKQHATTHGYYLLDVSTILQQHATTHGYYLLDVSTILQTTRYNARLLPARRKYNITNNTLQRMAINCSMYVQYYKQHATMHGYYLLDVSTILQTTRYNARLLPARRKYNITNNTLQRTEITCST